MEKYLALDFPGCPQDLANRLNQDLALPRNHAVRDVCKHPGLSCTMWQLVYIQRF